MTKICVAEGKLTRGEPGARGNGEPSDSCEGTMRKGGMCSSVSVSLFFHNQLFNIKTGQDSGCFIGISFNESGLVF